MVHQRDADAPPFVSAARPAGDAGGSRVFIVEGEKAADVAREVGLVATTSPHGSKSAGKADWSPVAGRDVVILPDHDDPGERYAADVVKLATAAGAKSVRVVRLVELWAGMPEGGDMADLVEHRGGDIDPIRAEVEALTDKTEADTVTPERRRSLRSHPSPLTYCPSRFGDSSPKRQRRSGAMRLTWRCLCCRGWRRRSAIPTVLRSSAGGPSQRLCGRRSWASRER